jgi:hypothetical protein
MTVIRGAPTLHRVSLSVDTGTFGLQDWAGALSADPIPRNYAGKPVAIQLNHRFTACSAAARLSLGRAVAASPALSACTE